MSKSICVILPINNAADELEFRVASLLQSLSGLVSHFEIVIVDDGSTDNTIETATRLSRVHSEVLFARHAISRGFEAAVETGMRNSHGIIVFICDKSLDEKLAGEAVAKATVIPQKNSACAEDQIINLLIDIGLTLKEYRVHPAKLGAEIVHPGGHPVVPKNHFNRLLRKVTASPPVESDE